MPNFATTTAFQPFELQSTTGAFSIRGATMAFELGLLEQWVHSYLRVGSWANTELSDRLREKERHWFGPFRLALSIVERQCGPEDAMIYHEPKESWDSRLKTMAEGISDPLALPPPIVNTMNGQLRNPDGTFRFVLSDGTHRVESLKLKGFSEFWCVAWFESVAQLEEFKKGSRPVLFGESHS